MTVVALGGLTGAGARTMGPTLAERMGADYVDRLILTNVARHVGATVEALHQREERPPTRGERFTRFLQRVLERSAVTGAGGDPYFGPGVAAFLTEEYEDLPEPTVTRGHELEDEKYIEGVEHAISDMATDENIVMVGRGCYYILRTSRMCCASASRRNWRIGSPPLRNASGSARTKLQEPLRSAMRRGGTFSIDSSISKTRMHRSSFIL